LTSACSCTASRHRIRSRPAPSFSLGIASASSRQSSAREGRPKRTQCHEAALLPRWLEDAAEPSLLRASRPPRRSVVEMWCKQRSREHRSTPLSSSQGSREPTLRRWCACVLLQSCHPSAPHRSNSSSRRCGATTQSAAACSSCSAAPTTGAYSTWPALAPRTIVVSVQRGLRPHPRARSGPRSASSCRVEARDPQCRGWSGSLELQWQVLLDRPSHRLEGAAPPEVRAHRRRAAAAAAAAAASPPGC